MINLIVFLLASFLALPGFLWADDTTSSPMVEKHIFLPEKPSSEKTLTLSEDKLKKKLSFTGVVISDKGKYALIKEKAQKKDESTQDIYREGDEISGAVITKIESNFLVLLNDGKEVNLKLFSGDKKRPAPVKASQTAVPQPKTANQAAQAKHQPGKSVAKGKNDQKISRSPSKTLDHQIRVKEGEKGNVLKATSNPFADALKKAMDNKKAAGGASTNPFIEAIKRAQQKKTQ